MISLKQFTTPSEMQPTLAALAKQARLRANHSRKKAAQMTGVPESTIRQFENTGKISLPQFIAIVFVYGEIKHFEQLFPKPPITELEHIINPPKSRQRGRL